MVNLPICLLLSNANLAYDARSCNRGMIVLSNPSLFITDTLFNQIEIKLYLPFSNWFGTKWTSVWFQINRKIVNTIWFRFDLIRFQKYFSVCKSNNYRWINVKPHICYLILYLSCRWQIFRHGVMTIDRINTGEFTSHNLPWRSIAVLAPMCEHCSANVQILYTEKTIFPFPLQFSFRFWTKWNSIWFKIERKTVTTIRSHSI